MATPSLSPGVEPRCRNCDSPLSGRYCSHCGQRDKPLDPTLHDLLHEAVHEFAHLDGKILASVRALLFRPGTLTAEWLAGRRARYIGPVRLYLTFSVLFFLLAALVPKTGGSAVVRFRYDMRGNAAQETGAWAAETGKKIKENPELVQHAFMANASRVMFVLLPVFAGVLRLVYGKATRRYPAFVYFALHYHAFLFAAFSVAVLARFSHNKSVVDAAEGAAMLWAIAYLFIALRKVFGGSRWRTAGRMALAAAAYFPCFALGLMAAALASLLMV